jgi:methionyl-tRNA formyltransferase
MGQTSPGGEKSDDYWTKIIMHNVEQFQKEKDAVKAKLRENQARMKEELLKQMQEHKLAKQQEKRSDMEYFEQIRKQKDDLVREEREKREAIQRKVIE